MIIEQTLFKSRVVAFWLVSEVVAIVIPNISFPTERSADFALDGYECCSVVAISTKSHLQNPEEYERLLWKIHYTVDTLNLKAIVVYDACSSNDQVMKCFSYAISKGINIIVPDNTLKSRNTARKRSVICDG